MIFNNPKDITAEQRLAIYRRSLEMYEQDRERNIHEGMCYYLGIATCFVYPNLSFFDLLSYLPEFATIHKEFGKDVEIYWWPIKKDRSPFFEAMIEEVENETNR